MRIIILGAKGLVGSVVYKELSKKHTVIGVDIDELNLNDIDKVKRFFNVNKADVLINLFGKNDHADDAGETVDTISEQEISDYFNVNVILLFRVIRMFIQNNEQGKIFSFSSLYANHVPNPKYYNGKHKSLGYVLSKAAVVMLNKYMAVHYPDYRFIDIIMGGVENNQDKSFKTEFFKHIVLQELLDPKEVAKLIDGLLDVDYITGTSIEITAGKNLF